MNKRRIAVLAWALLALGRGMLYLPLNPGYSDAPIALRILFDVDHIWIAGVVWLCIAALGLAVFAWATAPRWLERTWQSALLTGVSGWGGMYVSTGLLPDRFVPEGTPVYGLVFAGELYLAVALAIWATQDPKPVTGTLARRQRRVRTSSRGQ